MKRPEATTREALRDGILASGHSDFVSMADVQACICGGLLADLSPERRQLAVDTLRSLLIDGLVEVGDILGRNDPGFKPWPGSVDQVMARFVDRFIGNHDDPYDWQYTIWLNLTSLGEQASAEIVGRRQEK